ncbi:MAG: hypothetical protein WC975_09935 [Phycisphaerae bacterium]
MSRREFVLGVICGLAGCSQFPKQPPHSVDANVKVRCWKIHNPNQCDYFQYYDKNGKIISLGYDDNGDGKPDAKVDLLAVGKDDSCPHYVIMLDGIPYSVLEKMYEEGHFRLFCQPSELVSTFPSMTDLAYSEMLTPGKLLGFEALYYNRESATLSNGDLVYLKGENAPWEKRLNYRAPMLLDPIGYINPRFMFNHEMSGIEKAINRSREGTIFVYTVGTAMVGTKEGGPGIMDCLRRVEILCEKIVYERRGRCRITMLADHGHNLTASSFFDAAEALKKNGYHVTNKLSKPNDVICIQFGLVTYTAVYTSEPAKVASSMLNQEPVDLAIYPDQVDGEKKIVVRDRGGEAYVSKVNNRYRYEMVKGDPLKLRDIIKKLLLAGKVDKSGAVDDLALFEATVNHEFPDPLARIWRAFNGMVKYPPDLMLTIRDGWFSGKPGFARSVNVKSTHGSLNWKNSVTFIMSTIKPLPKALRMEDGEKSFGS